PFGFRQFAYVLERGREVEKRILAGSLIDAFNKRWPPHMQEAGECGYEMNIMQRVPKLESPARRNRKSLPRGDWTTSESSDDNSRRARVARNGEQGVDEILHLKMLQSVIDYDPAVMVLATGDAAKAEYSDGFKLNVERALQRGWVVELVAW